MALLAESAPSGLGTVDEGEKICCEKRCCCKKQNCCNSIVFVVLIADIFGYINANYDLVNCFVSAYGLDEDIAPYRDMAIKYCWVVTISSIFI